MDDSQSISLPQTPAEYRAWWAASTDIPFGFCQCGCGAQTRIASETDRSHLAFKGEPLRRLKGHGRKIAGQRYVVQDCGYETPCHVWQGGMSRANKGHYYPTLYRGGRVQRVNRLFYQDAHGSIPANWHIHHLCNNTHCVNVDHLEALDPARHRRTQAGRKLSSSNVAEIKARLRSGADAPTLAREHGVTREAIYAIQKGHIYSDL